MAVMNVLFAVELQLRQFVLAVPEQVRHVAWQVEHSYVVPEL